MTVVDARGHLCPVPSLRLRKAMEGLPAGSRLELMTTDPMAQIDVPWLMRDCGGRVVSVTETDSLFTITVETGAAPTG